MSGNVTLTPIIAGRGDAFPYPNMGQEKTGPGKIFYGGKTGVSMNPEGGDSCICEKPGEEAGCDPCDKE